MPSISDCHQQNRGHNSSTPVMLRSFLGRGKDVTRSFGEYNALRLASFWKIQHPRAQRRYDVAKKDIIMTLLDRKGVHALGTLPRGQPVATATAAAGFDSTRGASEAFCLHGTSAPMLLSLLKNGLNERYSGSKTGTAFGDGIYFYFAEDVAKSDADQYSAPDVGYDKSCDLHRRLYGKSYTGTKAASSTSSSAAYCWGTLRVHWSPVRALPTWRRASPSSRTLSVSSPTSRTCRRQCNELSFPDR